MESGRVRRTTLFKVPEPEKQAKLVEAFRVLADTQEKDGKRYIVEVRVGQAMPDERSNGYTVMVQMVFASLDDMKYYDRECPAHAAVREKAKQLGLVGRPLVVYCTEKEAE